MAKGNKGIKNNEKKETRLKPFIMTTVCRADILTAFNDVGDYEYKKIERIVDSLTDKEMELLASKLGESHVENGFWEDIKILFYEKFVPEVN